MLNRACIYGSWLMARSIHEAVLYEMGFPLCRDHHLDRKRSWPAAGTCAAAQAISIQSFSNQQSASSARSYGPPRLYVSDRHRQRGAGPRGDRDGHFAVNFATKDIKQEHQTRTRSLPKLASLLCDSQIHMLSTKPTAVVAGLITNTK